MSKRTLTITRNESGKQLSAVLRNLLKLDWTAVRQIVRNQQVLLDGKVCRKSTMVVRRGQTLEIQGEVQAPNKPDRNKDPRKRKTFRHTLMVDETIEKPVIRYVDKHIVVVDKPAGITTVRHKDEIKGHGRRAQRYLPPTLADLLPSMLAKGDTEKVSRVRAVHRLDRDTTGLIVFARTAEAESLLGKQIRSNKMDRTYLALVRGQAKSERIETHLIQDRGDGRRGSTDQANEGKRAVTHVKVVEDLGEFTVIECKLETGRTHQVRIHLGEQGTPLCGERVYDRPLNGKPIPDKSEAGRTMLHATFLGFEHPVTKKRMFWQSRMPDDMKAIRDKISRGRN